MIEWSKARGLIIAAVVSVLVVLVLIATASNSRRGDYSDCLRTAAAIQRGQSKAEVLAALSRYELTRNEARRVMAICHPVVQDVPLPYYPVMALEIDVDLDDRGQVTGVTTNDVLVWRKRAQ